MIQKLSQIHFIGVDELVEYFRSSEAAWKLFASQVKSLVKDNATCCPSSQ